ncbi:hypothetical protein Tco_1108869 [Tanacetum coccineum]
MVTFTSLASVVDNLHYLLSGFMIISGPSVSCTSPTSALNKLVDLHFRHTSASNGSKHVFECLDGSLHFISISFGMNAVLVSNEYPRALCSDCQESDVK